MRTMITTIASAALLGQAFLQPAIAGDLDSYPRVIGSGENMSVEYGPAARNNIVGGGHATASGSGDNIELRYAGSTNVQRPPTGMIPTVQGGGENLEVVWVPAFPQGMDQAVAKAPGTGR